ncbi:predicted protein [Pyrenophora tritici-repentis Pt-1C-BFP]|uniref:C2H2-type domain-containing protein n=1 Tax=Pyrenophora tritici-repentis (strain Pt-1C-BFP) TaxID=426418 RepID=B2W3I4_PYRTR|nr:uncharacterized protein PTRG_05034 [Pyrenophora tritici-repentis Pt-1C-BFP]EDU47941.1 predicted protein [Pyrenophora tritici-repentis Pt-1C-BFP]
MAEHPPNAYAFHHDSDGGETEEPTLLPSTPPLDATIPLNGPENNAALQGAQPGPTYSQHSDQPNGDIPGWVPEFYNWVDLDLGASSFDQAFIDSSTNPPLNRNVVFGFNGFQLGQAGTANDIMSPGPSPPMPMPNADEIQQSEAVYHTTTLAPTVPAPAPATTTNNVCTRCGKTFGRPSEMRRHAKKHLPPRFECNVEGCSKTFYRNDKLQDHLAKGHRNRYQERDQVPTFQCPLIGCNRTFYHLGECFDHATNDH